MHLPHLFLPQLCGVIEGLTVVSVNGHYLTSSFGYSHLLSPSDHLAPPPLHLTVLCERSKCVKLRPLPTGLGFHIRGHSPVVIHGVDKGSSGQRLPLSGVVDLLTYIHRVSGCSGGHTLRSLYIGSGTTECHEGFPRVCSCCCQKKS